MQSSNTLYLLSIAVALAGIFIWTTSTIEVDNSISWATDVEFARASTNIPCDIHVIENFDQLQQDELQGLESNKLKPFILRGLTKTWPANKKWRFENFTATYGKRLVKTGSESSIVYGGGIAGIPKSINAMISDLR